jgi:hypothetical protein
MQRLRATFIPKLSGFLLTVFVTLTVFAQQGPRPAQQQAARAAEAAPEPRPPVFFHEAWKIPSGPDPRRVFAQEWLSSPNLELKQYGPGTKGHGVEHQDEPRFKDFAGGLIVNTHGEPNNWAYIWSGFAEGNWAFTLKEKNSYVNLSKLESKIRWMSWESGFQLVRPVIKTADGKYYVGDKFDPPTSDWHEFEIVVADVRWLGFNPATATELGGGWQTPDLSKVDEVGVTTLSRGVAPGSVSCARIGFIEVIGNPVPRSVKSN